MNLFRTLILSILIACPGSRTCSLAMTERESAMAPTIGASIITIDNEIDLPLVTRVIDLGVPLSFVTLPDLDDIERCGPRRWLKLERPS